MIIVDQGATAKLLEQLEQVRGQAQGWRMVYLPANLFLPLPEGYQEPLVAAIQIAVLDDHKRLYFLEDGDIVLLAKEIGPNEFRYIKKMVLDKLKIPDDRVEFIELGLELNRVLRLIDAKDYKIKSAQQQEEQKKNLAQQELWRQKLLKISLDVSAVQRMPEVRQKRLRGNEKPEVMLIEDDEFSRRLVEGALGKLCQVTALGSAVDALDVYLLRAPDILFLDINLPDVTGHELLERIMAFDQDAYVVMLSGNGDRKNVLDAMGLGAKGFVVKPFTKDKLQLYIEKALARYKA